MMDKNYYSPIKSQWVQDVFKSVKDKIIEINIGRHPVFTADKLIKFWVKKPSTRPRNVGQKKLVQHFFSNVFSTEFFDRKFFCRSKKFYQNIFFRSWKKKRGTASM